MTREYLPKQKKSLTLYSTRHQFSANAKSAGVSKVELAALMGHAVDETATMHYGKRKHGSGHFTVEPYDDEVKKVKVKPTKTISSRAKRLLN